MAEGNGVMTLLDAHGILMRNNFTYGQMWMYFLSSWCLPKNSPLLVRNKIDNLPLDTFKIVLRNHSQRI